MGLGPAIPFVRGVFRDFFEDDVLSLAAAIAFYTALSFAPLVLLLVSVSFYPLLVLLFPGWVAIVSIVILTTERLSDDRPAAGSATS